MSTKYCIVLALALVSYAHDRAHKPAARRRLQLGTLACRHRISRRPHDLGRRAPLGRGRRHSALTDWGLGHVTIDRRGRVLDIGCGGGHVTILMARTVGPEGRVIGTDTDAEILALAREDAKTAKATNVEFQQQDACAPLWHNEFNVAYARFLLSHLNEPADCLAAVVEACLPGGTIVIEDTDFAGSFCYPPCAAYDWYKELYQELVERRGGD